MPLSPPQPPTGATTTTFQIGTYSALTDTFTSVFDCNDFTSTWVAWDSLKLPLADLIDVRGNNIRTPGEKISRIQYKNRHVTLALMIYGGTAQAVLNKEHALIAAIRNESLPYVLRVAAPGATNYSYFDVVKCTWEIPYDPQQYRAGFKTQITIDFECQPGIRGDRLTLQNFVANPGFEAPCGGASAPAPIVFSDTFANVSAYLVQSGSAPTLSPANTYVDIVQANAPAGGALLRYFRLDEASGTSAFDIGGSGATGTITASGVTYGVSGAISGDTDTAMTFTTSGNVQSASSSGLPTGSAACSLVCWVNCAALPAALGVATSIGNWANNPYLGVTSAGKAEAGITGLGTIDSTATPFTAAGWHMLALTSAGGTNGVVTLYVDGASAGTFTATANISYSNGVGMTINTNQGNTHALASS